MHSSTKCLYQKHLSTQLPSIFLSHVHRLLSVKHKSCRESVLSSHRALGLGQWTLVFVYGVLACQSTLTSLLLQSVYNHQRIAYQFIGLCYSKLLAALRHTFVDKCLQLIDRILAITGLDRLQRLYSIFQLDI